MNKKVEAVLTQEAKDFVNKILSNSYPGITLASLKEVVDVVLRVPGTELFVIPSTEGGTFRLCGKHNLEEVCSMTVPGGIASLYKKTDPTKDAFVLYAYKNKFHFMLYKVE